MKKIFFILIIFNFITFSSTFAQNIPTHEELRHACETLSVKPILNFYTSYGKLKYNQSYSRDNLTQLGKNMGMFESGDLASGLALVDIASEYELNITAKKMINNAVCVMPKELTVYIGFQNPVIYLATDLENNSCLYNLVLRHEQIHQQINVNALEYFIPLIYKQIKEIIKNMKPLYILSENKIKEATSELTTYYANQINLLVEEFKREILVEQRKLDNRKQYELESNICQRYNAKHHRK